MGYEPVILTDRLCCQAREAGSFLASILRTHAEDGKSLAFIAGGETVVKAEIPYAAQVYRHSGRVILRI